MYQTHWGIKESPFRGLLDTRHFFQSPTHEEALARLHFLIEQRRRLGLLVGPSGSGKSLLLKYIAEQLRRKGLPVARLSLYGVEPAEMLCQLAAGWGLTLDPSDSMMALWRAIGDRLAEYRYQQLSAVVLLDDADQAGGDVLRPIVRLAHYDTGIDAGLTIVLAGRGDGMAKLDESLLELAALRIDLEPWTQAETEAYLGTMLAQAGRPSRVFDKPAMARLHELSCGVPRRAAQLADFALLAGAGQNLAEIDASVVEEAYQALGS